MGPILTKRNIIPTHQFGFQQKYSIIDQLQQITNTMEKSREEKKSLLQTWWIERRCFIGYDRKD